MPSVTRFKGGFFDRGAVVAAMGKATAKALSKGGAFVRQNAKRSLRYRDKPSAVGQPPSVHRDDRPGGLSAFHGRPVSVLKEFIFFAWDSRSRTVVIGPAATNQVFFGKDRRPVTGTVPGVLEEGGAITLLEVFKFGRWKRADLRSRRRLSGLPQRYRTVRIGRRPFMRPALDKAKADLVGSFKGSLTTAGGGFAGFSRAA